METIFDSDKDRLLDIDLNEKREAEIREVVFSKLGTAEKWLLSESFGLETSRSEPAEAAVQKAAALWSEVARSRTHSGAQAFQSIDQELRNVLPEADSFWVTWNRFGKARGLIK